MAEELCEGVVVEKSPPHGGVGEAARALGEGEEGAQLALHAVGFGEIGGAGPNGQVRRQREGDVSAEAHLAKAGHVPGEVGHHLQKGTDVARGPASEIAVLGRRAKGGEEGDDTVAEASSIVGFMAAGRGRAEELECCSGPGRGLGLAIGARVAVVVGDVGVVISVRRGQERSGVHRHGPA